MSAKQVMRLEDMSPRGALSVLKQEDGDIIVSIIPDPNCKSMWPSAEFCSSGGGSPRTKAALFALYDAMLADNLDKTCGARQGYRGEGSAE